MDANENIRSLAKALNDLNTAIINSGASVPIANTGMLDEAIRGACAALNEHQRWLLSERRL